jgi:hypothetical protein
LADEAENVSDWTCMSVRIVIAVTRMSPDTLPPVMPWIALPRLLASASVSRPTFQA